MLPDFILPLTTFGAGVGVVARDVPACVFFRDFPAGTPVAALAAPAFNAELLRWTERVLTRVVVAPRLTLEDVARLGLDGRRELLGGYLGAVAPGESAGEELEAAAASDVRPEAEMVRCFRVPPAGRVRDDLAILTERLQLAPATVWTMPISEWLFNLHVLRTPDDAPIYTNDPSLG